MARDLYIVLPGDKKMAIESVLRVNHGGECAAVAICRGQLRVAKNIMARNMVADTLRQEQEHLNYFSGKLEKMGMRPTIMIKLWRHVSYALGYASGFLGGTHGIMACTNAVERVIDSHYQQQLHDLMDGEFKDNIMRFREDEVAHMRCAKSMLGSVSALSRMAQWVISQGCNMAIKISKVI